MNRLIGRQQLGTARPPNQIFNRERIRDLKIHFELDPTDVDQAVTDFVAKRGYNVDLEIVGMVHTNSGFRGLVARLYRAIINRVEATVIGIAQG